MLSRIRASINMVQFVVTVLITIVFMYIFRKNNRKVRRIWANTQPYLMGYDIKTKGEIDTDANLILINHQSLMDVVAIEALHPADICWIAKKELGQIPLFGHIMDAPRMIAVDRKNRRSLVKLLVDVKDRVSKGRVIAMFPEGTRGNGDKLLKFQSGAKILAEKLGLKVQPVIMTGTRHVFDSKTLNAHSGTIHVKFLDLVDPKEDKEWFENIKSNMQKALEDELANNSSDR